MTKVKWADHKAKFNEADDLLKHAYDTLEGVLEDENMETDEDAQEIVRDMVDRIDEVRDIIREVKEDTGK